VSAKNVKLVYTGHGDVVNLDVAQETGDGRLEPGRKITVSAELAEALQRSTPYWKPAKAAAKKRSAGRKKSAAAPVPAATPDAASSGAEKEDES
jgi:hypothetical protein